MQRNNEVHWFLIWLLYSPKKLKMYLEHSSGQLKLFNAFMNQTNRLLVWFMIFNFKVNYSKDNFFFPIILINTPKSNTKRRWETILINFRQSKKKEKEKRITHVPEFGELGYQAFIYYNFNLPKSMQKKKENTHVSLVNLPNSGTNLTVFKIRQIGTRVWWTRVPCEVPEFTKLTWVILFFFGLTRIN